jgi:acyl-CoA synthetase (AMP-forming)/AMP-acid ligase II
MLGAGATVVLMRRFDLENWLAWNQRYRATALAMPPPVVLALTKSPLWDRFKLDRIRRAMCGAAPLGADLQKAFEERTGLLLRQVWGMTEAASVISAAPNDPVRRKFGSCGHLLSSSEARVVDPASLQDVDAGSTGEIWLRGPNITQGYWRQPEATAETLVGEAWMRTGDIGYFDSDGCVFLVDRMKELIKYNALQVAPAELEDIIQSHPAVLDAAVVGAPDESCGEIPKAYVVLKGGAALGPEELMAYVTQRVAPHKKVRAVEFIDQIPKSPTGKILRRLLRERARGKAAEA